MATFEGTARPRCVGPIFHNVADAESVNLLRGSPLIGDAILRRVMDAFEMALPVFASVTEICVMKAALGPITTTTPETGV